MTLELFAVAAIRERHAPAGGIRAERVLERVGRADLAAAEAHELVAVAQAAAEGVAVVQNVVDDDAAVGSVVTVAPSEAWSTIRPLFKRPMNRLI